MVWFLTSRDLSTCMIASTDVELTLVHFQKGCGTSINSRGPNE